MQTPRLFNRFAYIFLMALASSPTVRAGVVTILGGEIKAGVKKNINEFYNSLTGHSSSIATGELNTVNLTATNLLWLTEPRIDFTTAELNTMAVFLSSGGRIAFMGEHGQVALEQNTRINTALSFLGSTIRISADAALDDNYRSASVADGQILAHPLTEGVNSYEYGWFAPLTISGTAQALMLGEEPFNGKPSIMMGYQNVGGGTVFVIGDQSMWDSASFSWPGGYDNARMFENLLIGATSTIQITGGKILLTPSMDTNLIKTTDTLTATIQNISGAPLIGQRVIFEIESGPHAGLKDTGSTDNSGKALFIYKGLTTGLDEIIATMKTSTDSLISSNHVFNLWKATASIDPIADAGSDRIVPAGASCDAAVMLDGTASTDPDGGSIVSYSWRLSPNRTVAGNRATVQLTSGIHEIILTVFDDEGSADDDTVFITIAGRIPALGGLSDTTIDEGFTLERRFTASGSNGTTPRITASGLPAGAVFADSGNGAALLTWNAGCNSHGRYAVTLIARDTDGVCKDSIRGSFALTVRDVNFAPEFLPSNDTAVPENLGFSRIVRVRDCDDGIPEIKAISVPSGSTFNDLGNGTAILEWAPGTIDCGYYMVVVEANDPDKTVRDTIVIHITGVTLPQLPPQLAGGVYVDKNGDGMVDAVYLQFSKEVPIDSMTISLSWTGARMQHMSALSGTSLSYQSSDHATVCVSIPDASQHANGIRTAGSMSAVVQFASPGHEQLTTKVIDNAAPVIDSAIYRVGTQVDADQPTIDTLHVWFSEPVRLGTVPTPFTLFSDTATEYSPSLELRSHQNNYAVFTIKGSVGFINSKNNDSIYINPNSAVGDTLTWQNNPANRRVLLRWEPGTIITIIPINTSGTDPMDISTINKPLGINENSGKIIVIDTKLQFDSLRHDEELIIDKSDGNPVFGYAMIYDPVGNLVKASLPIKKAAIRRLYYVLWDGTNRNHRRVAQGAYLVRTTFTINNNPGKADKKLTIRWR